MIPPKRGALPSTRMDDASNEHHCCGTQGSQQKMDTISVRHWCRHTPSGPSNAILLLEAPRDSIKSLQTPRLQAWNYLHLLLGLLYVEEQECPCPARIRCIAFYGVDYSSAFRCTSYAVRVFCRSLRGSLQRLLRPELHDSIA